jgi:hypothetical protein
MPNVMPTLFIAITGTILVLTLLWLWQSVRHVFVHALVADSGKPLVSAERAGLLAEKQSLLVALKDLEAERDSGKLSSNDYRELNQQYRLRARDVLRQLDALVAPHRAEAKQLLDETLQVAPAVAPVDVPVVASAAVGCASCGASNDTDAVFCKKCGSRLKAEALA